MDGCNGVEKVIQILKCRDRYKSKKEEITNEDVMEYLMDFYNNSYESRYWYELYMKEKQESQYWKEMYNIKKHTGKHKRDI